MKRYKFPWKIAGILATGAATCLLSISTLYYRSTATSLKQHAESLYEMQMVRNRGLKPDSETQKILDSIFDNSTAPEDFSMIEGEDYELYELSYPSNEDTTRIIIAHSDKSLEDDKIEVTSRTTANGYQREEVRFKPKDGNRKPKIIIVTPSAGMRDYPLAVYEGEGEKGPLYSLLIPEAHKPEGAHERKMEFKGKSLKELKEWQVIARKKLLELMMGDLPMELPIDYKVHLKNKETHPLLPGTHLVFERPVSQTSENRQFRAILYSNPELKGKKAPGILAIPGHSGKGDYSYGKKLADEGFVVIYPEINYHHKPQGNWSLNGERLSDCQIALDYLIKHPNVDSERIGCVGLSLGGEMTMYLAAVDERVKVAVVGGFLTSYRFPEDYKPSPWGVITTWGACDCAYIPEFGKYFDYPYLFCLIAPRTLIVETGMKDADTPITPSIQLLEPVRKVYELYGTDNFFHIIHPSGHELNGEVSIPLLKKYLMTEG